MGYEFGKCSCFTDYSKFWFTYIANYYMIKHVVLVFNHFFTDLFFNVRIFRRMSDEGKNTFLLRARKAKYYGQT